MTASCVVSVDTGGNHEFQCEKACKHRCRDHTPPHADASWTGGDRRLRRAGIAAAQRSAGVERERPELAWAFSPARARGRQLQRTEPWTQMDDPKLQRSEPRPQTEKDPRRKEQRPALQPLS